MVPKKLREAFFLGDEKSITLLPKNMLKLVDLLLMLFLSFLLFLLDLLLTGFSGFFLSFFKLLTLSLFHVLAEVVFLHSLLNVFGLFLLFLLGFDILKGHHILIDCHELFTFLRVFFFRNLRLELLLHF